MHIVNVINNIIIPTAPLIPPDQDPTTWKMIFVRLRIRLASNVGLAFLSAFVPYVALLISDGVE